MISSTWHSQVTRSIDIGQVDTTGLESEVLDVKVRSANCNCAQGLEVEHFSGKRKIVELKVYFCLSACCYYEAVSDSNVAAELDIGRIYIR